jgi:hypothetical protein
MIGPTAAFLARHEIATCLTVIPFGMVLGSVFRQRTSAGISRHCVSFSCAGSALLLFASSGLTLRLFYAIRLVLCLVLFCAVHFMFSLKSEKLRDPKLTLAIVPAAAALALVSFWDSGLREYIGFVGRWLSTLAIACQAIVTKRTRRVTVFNGRVPVFVLIAIVHFAVGFEKAATLRRSETWTLWATSGVGIICAA